MCSSDLSNCSYASVLKEFINVLGNSMRIKEIYSMLMTVKEGFVLVVAYCYAGGIRASIWTDAAQSCVMLVGSTILCWISIQEVGGLSGLKSGLNAQDPALTNLLPPNLMFGLTLWIAAFFLGGLSVAGQPQVVSRVMTLGNDKDRKEAMIWFFVWQTPLDCDVSVTPPESPIKIVILN